MKTTGEVINSIEEIKAGDYYLCHSRIAKNVFLCKVHLVDKETNSIIESSSRIAFSSGLCDDNFSENCYHLFNDKRWRYRWPTKEELIKFGVKPKKTMFHEYENN